MTHEEIKSYMEGIAGEVSRHIVGQGDLIEQTLFCIFAGGNLLLEGVPGLGKTKLVSTLGKVLGLEFKRIQFTPDLMPADITGTNIYNKENNRFEFQAGPVFSNLLLADEINRATPKTQAAMLEAMQEKAVTVGNQTYALDQPYIVLATQNPIEQEGTYPLPEAQLDRFMFKLNVEFPDVKSLSKIVLLTTGAAEQEVHAIGNKSELLTAIQLLKDLPIAEAVLEKAMELVVATHPTRAEASEMVKKYVLQGSSPRGAQGLIQSSRARAVFHGRYNVAFEDIKAVAKSTLRHRLILNYNAVQAEINEDKIIDDLMAKVFVNG